MRECANCRKVADLRAGWRANGEWMEADFCNPCMEKTWSMFKSTPTMTTAIFNTVGEEIFSADVIAKFRAAALDDAAALRDL